MFGVFLVLISPHLDWLLRFTPHISVFSPSAGKCRKENLRTRIRFTQCVSLRWNCKHTDSLDSNSSFIFIWIEISKSWHEALTRISKKDGIEENMIKINLVFLISLLFANLDRSLRLLLEFFWVFVFLGSLSYGHCVVPQSPISFSSVNRFTE